MKNLMLFKLRIKHGEEIKKSNVLMRRFTIPATKISCSSDLKLVALNNNKNKKCLKLYHLAFLNTY